MNTLNIPKSDASAPASRQFDFRVPTLDDGKAVWRLIQACPPLEENSQYCNLLQCTHFAETCVLAERNGEAVGWLSAYRLPEDPETVFIWQVAVHPDARGVGLGSTLIDRLLARPGLAGVKRIMTTITPGNRASWALFESLAKRRNAPLQQEEWLKRGVHFSGDHETECLLTIGPWGSRQ